MNAARGLAFLCALVAGACSTSATANVPYGELALPDTTLSMDRNYLRVAPLDLVEIWVFGVEELKGTYQVDPEGKIRFPLIGIVDAQGYATFELAARIEEKLRNGFVTNPQVSVRISEASGQQLTVEGAVQKPGMFPVRGRLSLLQAIAISGGPTPGADPSRVVIFRYIEGKRMAAAYNLLKIRGGEVEDPIVYGNDIIVMDGDNVRQGYEDIIRSIPVLGLFMMAG